MASIMKRWALATSMLLYLGGAHAADETYLRIACDGADTGAEVVVNGVFKGECPLDIQVQPGTIRIRAVKNLDASMERVFEQELRMGGGTAKRIEIVLSEPRMSAAAKAREAARIAAEATAAAKREAERQAAAAAEKQRAAEKLRRLQAAAEARDPSSMYLLARRYEDGVGLPADRELALAWYRRAANAGYMPAQAGVAAFAFNGWLSGGPDYGLARELALPAAEAGVPRGMLITSMLYSAGVGGVAKNTALADEWLVRAASAELPRAMNRYANVLAERKQYDEALIWARRALDADKDGFPGDVEAMSTIAFVYGQDDPNHPKDSRKSFDWYLKAAEAGSVTGMVNVGHMYYSGTGISKDAVKAMSWMLKAAEKGDATAMGNIGIFYHFGAGVPVDKAKAIEWYTKAIAAGSKHPNIRNNLTVLTGASN